MQKEENEQSQSFLWDGNVVSVLDENSREYYFQDELGSPIRLADAGGRLAETFGYDEFGQDLYGNREGNSQGRIQPFGYTGYQHDKISGTYFAQAREYLPEIGRFTGRDKIKGFAAAPMTLNEYGYCWENPFKYVDLNGFEPEEPDVYVYYIEDFEEQAKWKIKQLEKEGYNVVEININKEAENNTYDPEVKLGREFMDQWKDMPEELDMVYIFCHGNEKMLQFKDRSLHNGLTLNGLNSKKEEVAGDIHSLEEKEIDVLYIQACNTGHIDALSDPEYNGENVASVLSKKIGDGETYAWDGSVSFNFLFNREARISIKQGHFKELIREKQYPKRKPIGQVLYKNGIPDSKYYKE